VSIAHGDDATRVSLGPRFAEPGALQRYPLKPCHLFWRVLLQRMESPYFETKLMRRNPERLPGVGEGAKMVPPAEAAVIRTHLEIMGFRVPRP